MALVATPGSASANGNVSHQWVSTTAIELTPEGGSLRELVGDPTLLPMLVTGTMYPDWGYTPGATSEEREAGEASHWEPVQDAYREWIMANHAPPWSDEARPHLAFYLGLTSHGIADQSYDAMFFERSLHYEPVDHSEFDQDTDVLWAAAAGPGETPRPWVPADVLLMLFQRIVGVAIEEPSMAQQLGFVAVGIQAVNALAGQPEQVADAAADFPWAAAHDDDPATPGNPPHEAEIARRYWRSNWSLLHGDPVPRPVLWTHPVDGGASHAIEAASIESWISIVFARALEGPDPEPSYFHLTDSQGNELAITLDLFYGDGSHVVHLRPVDDLLADEVYVVTVDPGLPTIHGEALEGWSFAFSTGARGPMPHNDDAFWDEPDPYGDEPEGDTTTTGGSDETGAQPGGSSSGDPSGDPSTSGDTGVAASDGDDDTGCGCRTDPRRGHAGTLALGLLLLGLARRRAPRRAASRARATGDHC